MRYDVVSSRKDKNDKWRNIRIGAAFPQEDGRINIVLDALPISIWEGQVRLTLFEAKEDDDAPQRPARRQSRDDDRDDPPPRRRDDRISSGRSPRNDMDDEIPFSPEFR